MLALIPRPVRVDERPGRFVFTDRTEVSADPSLRPAARLLQELLRPLTRLPLSDAAPDAAPQIVFTRDDALADEQYTLDAAPGRLHIAAGGERGAMWAVQTLRQLLPPEAFRAAPVADTVWEIPAVHIDDTPAFGWRGLMLDVARHFAPVAEVRRVIDQMAAHKLNTLHLHLTDDQGWRLQIDAHPRLTERGAWRSESQWGAARDAPGDGRPHGGFYTHDDIREIVAFAASRGITVVPEIEMPGHVQAALSAYPELGVTAPVDGPWTRWGVNPHVLTMEASTVAFFCDVLDEVIALFPSTVIGVGGDECATDEWAGDPRTQERRRELGLSSDRELQNWFLGRIGDHLAARGRRLFGWDEILAGRLADDAVVASWRGTTGLVAAARRGHDVIACPEDVVYLDYRQSDRPDEPIPVGTVTDLARAYTFDPVPTDLAPEHRSRVLGGQAALWTEHVDTPARRDYMLFPRLAAVAERLWTPDAGDVAEFTARLRTHLRRWDAAGIAYRPLDGPHPWQLLPNASGRPRDRAERLAEVAALVAENGAADGA